MQNVRRIAIRRYMKASQENPDANQLGAGVSPEQLQRAVTLSGYPLQRVVAQQLLRNFSVTEEWGYIDRDSKQHRTLDVFAFRNLRESENLWVGLALLVECKRSELPYVFFQAASPKLPYDFPSVVGLGRKELELHKPGVGSRSVSGAQFLKLHDTDFVAAGPPISSAFARAERKGKELDLSGGVPFNQAVLPLLSARQHFAEIQKGISGSGKVAACVALCVCVLDAPMVCVAGGPEAAELSLAPWVRVVRQEAAQDRHWVSTRHHVVDFVHRAFLGRFVEEHALPFADAFCTTALKSQKLLRDGKGRVPDWDNWTLADLQPVT